MRSRSTFGSSGNLGGLLHPGAPIFPAAASQAAFEGSEKDALEPPRPVRRTLATFPCQPSHLRVRSQFCLAGQCMLRTRVSARNWPA